MNYVQVRPSACTRSARMPCSFHFEFLEGMNAFIQVDHEPARELHIIDFEQVCDRCLTNDAFLMLLLTTVNSACEPNMFRFRG